MTRNWELGRAAIASPSASARNRDVVDRTPVRLEARGRDVIAHVRDSAPDPFRPQSPQIF